jgi:hypothetical protein
VFLAGLDTEALCFVVRYINSHAKKRRREDLALRISLERQRAASVERAVEQKVERAQIGELESLDVTANYAVEMLFHTLACDLAFQKREPLGAKSDHSNVCCVTLVAGSRVRNVE